jgi:hypothetical protein
MPSEETKYFDDSYSRLVKLRDGKPYEFGARGRPYPKSDEPALAKEIEALTGYRVAFGAWEHLFEYNPLDEECRVPLTVVETES